MKSATHGKKACPVTTVAGLLSDPWTMLIVHNLLGAKKPMRFCELERALVGVSTRTLTLKLKRLEHKAIVLKTEHGYRLSKKGSQLAPVIRAMEYFGRKL
jgi:DNA-binding HxlR family transcriptional regulator